MDTMVTTDVLGKRSLPGGSADGDDSSSKTSRVRHTTSVAPTRAYSVRPEYSVSNVRSVSPYVPEMMALQERRTTELLAELVSVRHELSSSVYAHSTE